MGSYVPEDDVQALRQLVRLRHSLQKIKKNYQRRASSLLGVICPEYTQLVKNPFGEISCMILAKYPTAIYMREAEHALVCVGKKLAYIMYSILKNESLYDPQRVFVQT